MASFADGNVKTKEQFESTVNMQSLRWNNGYPFAGFIIKDNSTDDIVGYEVIGNSGIRNQAEMAYLFSKAYHRSDKVKDVGYENAGALCLEYGRNLYNSKSLVNQSFDQDKAKFEGGNLFSSVTATARDDNPGSYKILEKLGFIYKEDRFMINYL
jgi:RimJ/RimL family protein N-acetyltransferase